MNDRDGPSKRGSIRHLLLALAEQAHMSPEMILAYARGVLSQEGHLKVAEHLKSCEQCAEVFASAKGFVTSEQQPGSAPVESNAGVELSPQMKSKLELVAQLHSGEERLTEMVARLFLPQDCWLSIRPVVDAIGDYRKHVAVTDREDTDEIAAAAFVALVGENARHTFTTIVAVADFVSLVHSLLLERCRDWKDIAVLLGECVGDAIPALGSLCLEDTRQRDILHAFAACYSLDDK